MAKRRILLEKKRAAARGSCAFDCAETDQRVVDGVSGGVPPGGVMPVPVVPGEAPLELDDVSDDPDDPEVPDGAPDEEAAPELLLPEAGVSGVAPAGGMLGLLGIVALGATGVGAMVPADEPVPADDPVVPPGVPEPPDCAPVPASLLQPASRTARMLAATSTLDGWFNNFILVPFEVDE